MKHASVKQRGFSLIEVIIVLTAAALIGAFITSFFGKSYFESMKAGSTLTKAQGLQKVMENIFSDFKKTYTTNLTDLQTNVGLPENSDMVNTYGTYKVIENHFIKFVDAGGGNWTEAAGAATDLLKVTIKNELGETLTLVFSPQ